MANTALPAAIRNEFELDLVRLAHGELDGDAVIVEDETLRYGFVQLPVVVLKADFLSAGAKLTYAGFLNFSRDKGYAFPGQMAIAELIGASKRSIVTWIQELDNVGLVIKKRRGLGKSNVYFLPRIVRVPQFRALIEHEAYKSRSAKSALQEVQTVHHGSAKSAPTEVHNLRTEVYTLQVDEVEQHNDDDATVALRKAGINASQARRLAASYAPEVILNKIDLVEYLKSVHSPLISRNAAGWLVKAITEDFTAPQGYKSKAVREREAMQRAAFEAELAAAEASRRDAIKAMKANRPAKKIAGTTLTTKTLWDQALTLLKDQVSPLNYDMWLKNAAVLLDYQGGQALIGATYSYSVENLRKLAPVIEKALTTVVGSPTKVAFTVMHEAAAEEATPTKPPNTQRVRGQNHPMSTSLP
jgi:hypothetical protein